MSETIISKSKARIKRYRATKKGRAMFHRLMSRYRKTKKGKATQKRYNTCHPKRIKARSAVQSAVQSGKLPHPDTLLCEYCRAQAKQYHHYKGYAPEHKLDVIPVCKKCHREIP